MRHRKKIISLRNYGSETFVTGSRRAVTGRMLKRKKFRVPFGRVAPL